ncbi:Uncharacterised protein [Trueperella bialowiezensis]|uniref:Uncharacterized protein n=1 Tax=Trueperella bialowiezensis TaxID=312285 RepID=A0A3S4Z546_9ACTO|nr:Uncharacterised protein [Trueperella bialowiezensis]
MGHAAGAPVYSSRLGFMPRSCFYSNENGCSSPRVWIYCCGSNSAWKELLEGSDKRSLYVRSGKPVTVLVHQPEPERCREITHRHPDSLSRRRFTCAAIVVELLADENLLAPGVVIKPRLVS